MKLRGVEARGFLNDNNISCSSISNGGDFDSRKLSLFKSLKSLFIRYGNMFIEYELFNGKFLYIGTLYNSDLKEYKYYCKQLEKQKETNKMLREQRNYNFNKFYETFKKHYPILTEKATFKTCRFFIENFKNNERVFYNFETNDLIIVDKFNNNSYSYVLNMIDTTNFKDILKGYTLLIDGVEKFTV